MEEMYEEKVSNEHLKINYFIKVRLADSNDLWYGTYVRLIGKSSIMIDLPVRNNKDFLILNEGDELDCKFTRFNGVYTFSSKFKSYVPDFNLMILTRPAYLRKTELRDHIRVSVNIPAKINNDCDGNIVNLSLGGLLINTDCKLCVGDVVQLCFHIDQSSLNINCQVVRKGDDNQYGLRFIELSRPARITIDHYILERIIEDKRVVSSDMLDY
ncbi:MAG: PilZ domain-containing protein [Firmicutes bacterium]|nr:PilZ domain-containing protein [Bacillota bacterium]